MYMSETQCCGSLVQHEISLDAYNRLTSTPDAKGRTIEVIKVPVPYPLFRTYKEANGVHVSVPMAVASHMLVALHVLHTVVPADPMFLPTRPVRDFVHWVRCTSIQFTSCCHASVNPLMLRNFHSITALTD